MIFFFLKEKKKCDKKKKRIQKKKMIDFDIELAAFKTAWNKWTNKSFQNEWDDLRKFMSTFQKTGIWIDHLKEIVEDEPCFFFKVVLPFVLDEALLLQGTTDQLETADKTISLPRHVATRILACVFLGALHVPTDILFLHRNLKAIYAHLKQCIVAVPRGSIAIRLSKLTTSEELNEEFFRSLNATPLIYQDVDFGESMLEIVSSTEELESQPEWTAVKLLFGEKVLTDFSEIVIVAGLSSATLSNENRFSHGSLCQVLCIIPECYTKKALLCAMATPMFDVYGKECKNVWFNSSSRDTWILASIAGKNWCTEDDEMQKLMDEHQKKTVTELCQLWPDVSE
jgi:hypothetical protein